MFSSADFPNRFDFREAQDRIYQLWENRGCFHAVPDASKKPFSIVIPPPNVTGALHLGHALNNSLQDFVIRFKRMQGFNALWTPGTDHAGIATQAVVEKRLKEIEGKTRHDLGRTALVERIWKWKEEYEARILGQLKRMGASCDWERTRFTLDPVCAKAVRATFFDLFEKKLLYRGKRLVNWDTFLQTTVSDDEVFHETVKGHFWHFRYPVIDPQPGEPAFVNVATTRPIQRRRWMNWKQNCGSAETKRRRRTWRALISRLPILSTAAITCCPSLRSCEIWPKQVDG
jgi:valyl-tRNA synthetase